jgi:hypothetical protein
MTQKVPVIHLPAGVDPQNVLKSKVLPENIVNQRFVKVSQDIVRP